MASKERCSLVRDSFYMDMWRERFKKKIFFKSGLKEGWFLITPIFQQSFHSISAPRWCGGKCYSKWNSVVLFSLVIYMRNNKHTHTQVWPKQTIRNWRNRERKKNQYSLTTLNGLETESTHCRKEGLFSSGIFCTNCLNLARIIMLQMQLLKTHATHWEIVLLWTFPETGETNYQHRT